MKTLFAIVMSIALSPAPDVLAQQAPAPALERHEFVIRNFKTESGVVLPRCEPNLPDFAHSDDGRREP